MLRAGGQHPVLKQERSRHAAGGGPAPGPEAGEKQACCGRGASTQPFQGPSLPPMAGRFPSELRHQRLTPEASG